MPGFNIKFDNSCHDDGINHYSRLNGGPLNNIETARKHRYLIEFLEPYGSQNEGILLYCEKCTRPSPEVDKITIHNGQDEIYRPGKQRWYPIDFTFYEKTNGEFDNLTNQTAELMYKWWAEVMINLSRSVHNNVSDYYKRCHLKMLDGEGRPIWTYYLYDCWPQKISPIDLSYSDSDIATITVTLNYNKCEERRE